MRTDHVDLLMLDYLNGKLDASGRVEVELHLEHCAACRDELDGLRETLRALKGERVPGPPEGYFATLAPRVRERLARSNRSWFAGSPIVTRLVLPLAAAAVVIFVLLSVPFTSDETEKGDNPLQSVLRGTGSNELIDVVLDFLPQQPFSSPLAEGETSSLLAAHLLRSDRLLADAEEAISLGEFSFADPTPPELEQLTEEDVSLLVQRLGERTSL